MLVKTPASTVVQLYHSQALIALNVPLAQGDLKVVERSLKWPCHSERSEESVQDGERDSSLRSE